MIGFVAFYLVPTIRGVYLSFTEYSILGDPTWIGIKNYTAIFADELFWNAMAVTLQYVGTEHRLPDRHRPRPGAADAPAWPSPRLSAARCCCRSWWPT